MLIWLLAQASRPDPPPITPEDRALVNLLLIIALLGLGILLIIELLAAWRNLLQRQREMESEHEDREADLPHPDAWQTAAQRLGIPGPGPDEAHIKTQNDIEHDMGWEDDEDNPKGQEPGADEDEEDDGDDFPFGDDEGKDDDPGPIGRA